MSYVKGYECTLCGKVYEPSDEFYTCPDCGIEGIVDVLYDYDSIKKVLTKESLAADKDPTLWRYLPLLPVTEAYTDETLKVGGTPLYRSKGLKEYLGVRELFIKDEGINPTSSLKDRASVIAAVKAKQLGKKKVACSSTGNAASSLAGNCAHMGLKTVIFVPDRAPEGKLAQLMIYGAVVAAVKGDYKVTFDLSQKAITAHGWYNRNAAINPLLVEGKKTVALEIAEQLDFQMPDWVVVSVGDGCTIGGVYKGFFDLKELGIIKEIPRILGVQAEGCAPLYKAFVSGQDLEPAAENTIADSISVGVPRNPVKALNAVKYSGGTYITVTDDEILNAMKILGQKEGIFGEPAGVAGTAGLKKALEQGIVDKDASVVTIVTGNGLKDVKRGLEVAGKPMHVEPGVDLTLFNDTCRETDCD